MIRRPPRSTRTDTLFPYTTLFRSRGDFAVRSLRAAQSPRGRFSLRPARTDPLHRPPSLCPDELAVEARLGADVELRGAALQGRGRVRRGRNEGRHLAARPEERRVGKGCGSTCRYRWSAENSIKKKKKNTSY